MAKTQVVETEVAFPAPRELLVVENNSTSKNSPVGEAWSAVLIFLLGIFLGACVTALVLYKQTPNEIITEILSADDTEPDALEHGIAPEGVKVTEGEATGTLQFLIATSSRASATSSPFSIKIPVMIYHSVRPHIAGQSKYQELYDVTPELLEEELLYLKQNGYHPILLRDVDAYWRGATSSLPEKPVILTFDDGWKNQYEYAFPLLEKHNMKAVFFIFTNPLDHNKSKWMSWEDVRELDKAGMEIGGHTRTHPILTKISHDNKKLDDEILEPKHIIERELGHSIVSFAYPFGAKDEAVEIAVARAGYQLARTTISGVWNDPLHRLQFHGTLSSDKLESFEALMNKP